MKWIQNLAKVTGAAGMAAGACGMMSNQADAADFTAGTTDGFVMMTSYGKQANTSGNDTVITGSIGGGTWSVASTKPFFKNIWTAHGGTTFGPGTYTIDTIEGPVVTFTVGAGQVGGHILFDWSTTSNIDVVNVWDVTGNTYTSRDWDDDGKNLYYGTAVIYPGEPDVRGGEMVDGPFQGFNANFNFVISAVCGNGVVEGAEACDDNNMDAGDGCDASCAEEAGWICDGADPTTCTEDCGDGLVVGDEDCDDGNTVDTDGCPTTCEAAFCGDGFIQAGVEACDDGDTIDGDGCSSICQNELCGNGIVDGLEECDGDGAGTGGETATCDANCTAASCGDGTTNAAAGEACDDAGESATCDANCTAASCGDGTTNAAAGEACDDGNTVDTDGCLTTCVAASCGDGFVQAGVEACDDGNTVDTDGCLTTCVAASCGDGFVQAGVEACDDGNGDNTDGCLDTCAAASCGDGFVQAGVEGCDDGNGDNTDGCLDTCVAAFCGDGFVQAGVEACDDGNAVDTDGCLTTCVAASCGDGFVQAGVEVCDDSNAVSGDGCSATCDSTETCGNGIVDSGEPCDDANTDDTDGCLSTCEKDVDLDGLGDNPDACDNGAHDQATEEVTGGGPALHVFTVDSGTFEMGGVTVTPIDVVPGNPGELREGFYQPKGEIFEGFPFTGPLVRVYTAASNLGDTVTPAGTIDGGPEPSFDVAAGTADLSALFANWNGSDFNQGGIATITDNGDGTMTLSWSSLIVGGAFDGFEGSWTMNGTLVGGVSEGDDDGDGVDNLEDNCPSNPNADQADADGDGIGDACDICPDDAGDDADGDCRCANPADPDGLRGFDDDNDGDGIFNGEDPTPNDYTDTDGDGEIDNVDDDDDGDGVLDVDDVFPLDSGESVDTDGDGQGDNGDPCPVNVENDADGDGVCEDVDVFPANPHESRDLDDDGVGDNADACEAVGGGGGGSGSGELVELSFSPLFVLNLSFQMPGVGEDRGIPGGTDGGIILDGETFQNSGAVGERNNLIIDPSEFIFFGNQVAVGLYPNDPAGGRPGDPTFPPPSITDNGDGTVTFDFRAWTAFWNGTFFNQGPTDTELLDFDPEANTTSGTAGSDELVVATNGSQGGQTVGTIDSSTNKIHLEWNSVILGGPFNKKIGHWILDLDDDPPDICPTDPNDDQDGDCLCANPDDPDGEFGFDDDNDGDGVLNGNDAFPDDPTETVDTDGDGTGNNADTDDDDDGIPDHLDSAPLDDSQPLDADGDGVPAGLDADDDNAFVQVDEDGDGIDDITPRNPVTGEPVVPRVNTPVAGGLAVSDAAGDARILVDAARVAALAAAADALEAAADALPAGDPDKVRAVADAAAARARADSAAAILGVAVEIPAGTKISGVDTDNDGLADDHIVVGIALTGEVPGQRLIITLEDGNEIDTSILGWPIMVTPDGAIFDPFARVTVAYDQFDVPERVDERHLVVLRTDLDGLQTILQRPCDDTVDHDGDGVVDAADIDFDCVETRDPPGNTITVRTRHFSDFAVVVGDADGDGIADDRDAAPTVPEGVDGGGDGLDDRTIFSRINKDAKNGLGCSASRTATPPWGAVALLLLPLATIVAARLGRTRMKRWLGIALFLALAAPSAWATTTLFPTGFGAKMAAMGGAANAAGDDATAVATNPANLTRIDGWRVDLDVGALISNVNYTDRVDDPDGPVNNGVGGRFEINEGTLYFLPTMAVARKMGRVSVGFGMWGKGGGGLAFQDFGLNDVTPADMGGGRAIYITNGSDVVGDKRLTEQNAVRRDNNTLMIIGRFGLALAYDVTDDFTVAVEPLQDYGFLKFSIFGSTPTAFDENGDGVVSQFEGTIARGLPMKRFFQEVDPDTNAPVLPDQRMADNFSSFGRLFAGDSFPAMILPQADGTRRAGDVTYFNTVGEMVTRPSDGVARIAKFFDQDLNDKAIHTFHKVTGESEGFVTDATIREVLDSIVGGMKNQAFYNPENYTDQEADFIIDEFFGLFQDQFVDAGFGMGEVTAYATGRGLEDFANAVKFGARWQVADWLTVGGSYTSRSELNMRDGRLQMDFTNQIQQGLDVGLRSFLVQQFIFDKLGMQKIAGFVDDVADGRTADFGTMFDPNPNDGVEQGNLDQIDTVEELLTQVTGFGALVGGFGDNHTIPTNADIDIKLVGATQTLPTDDRAAQGVEVATPADSVEHLTRASAGLFRQFSYLMGYVDDSTFQTVTNQPNYKIPKRLNDSINNAAQQAAPGLTQHDATSGAFAGGGVIGGTIVRAVDDQEVIDYYRDIARFLRGFGVASIADPDDAATQAQAVAQVRTILNPNNYATPQEFLSAYDTLRSQFDVVGTFDSDITIELPQQVEFGIEIAPLPALRLTTDVKWADYSSSFKDFSASLSHTDNEVYQRFLGLAAGAGQKDFGSVTEFTFKEDLNWHDQWIFNFGAAYDLLDNFTVMAGYSFTGRRLNDLWNNFGEAKSAMDDNSNMALLPAFGYETVSAGFSYRWNNKEISLALERAFTQIVTSDSPNFANSLYENSKESASQETVHVQYSLAF